MTSTIFPSHHWSIATSQNGMGAVQEQAKVAAVALGFEWLSALIPVFIIFILSVCCYRKRHKNNSSQTDNATTTATPMTEVAPKPVGEVQGQVRGEKLVINIEQTDEPVPPKDFILVVSEH